MFILTDTLHMVSFTISIYNIYLANNGGNNSLPWCFFRSLFFSRIFLIYSPIIRWLIQNHVHCEYANVQVQMVGQSISGHNETDNCEKIAP